MSGCLSGTAGLWEMQVAIKGKNVMGNRVMKFFNINLMYLVALRDIGTFNGFPKDYIPHYTIILVMFIVSIILVVVFFLIKNKRIPSDMVFLLAAVSITNIILSILTVSSIMDYADINFLSVDGRFTILILLMVLINFVSLTLLTKRHERQIKQLQKT